MKTILILSAGEQERFPEGFMPKQLLCFGGESMFARQLRQLKTQPQVPIVMTHRKELADIKGDFIVINPVDHRTILRTLRSSRPEWIERVIVLLGDVHYDDDLMDDIVESEQPMAFWLSGSEIYALAFNPDRHEEIIRGIDRAEVIQPIGPHRKAPETRVADRKLWHLYRALNTNDIHTHHLWNNPMTVQVDGRAFDVDSYRQYLDIEESRKPA